MKPKGMGWCNKPIKLQFQSVLIRKILMLSNATNQPKSTVELCCNRVNHNNGSICKSLLLCGIISYLLLSYIGKLYINT